MGFYNHPYFPCSSQNWTYPLTIFLSLCLEIAKPFKVPEQNHILRFRYTTYMGEFHPAEKKVVVHFCPSDLGLTLAQEEKLIKLAGPRYNPETETVKMSCESFDHQAQNKRFLLDTINKLVETAKVILPPLYFKGLDVQVVRD